MAKKKGWGINFEGFTELSEKYVKLGGDLKEIAGDCLKFIPKKVNPQLKKAMAKHERTEKTVKTLVEGQTPSGRATLPQYRSALIYPTAGLLRSF